MHILSKVKSTLKEKLDPELLNNVLDKVSPTFPVFSVGAVLTSPPIGEQYILSEDEVLNIIQEKQNSWDDVDIAVEMLNRLKYRIQEKYFKEDYDSYEEIGNEDPKIFLRRPARMSRSHPNFEISFLTV